MKRMCHQCQEEMIEDCKVTVEGGFYGIKVSETGNGMFNNASSRLQAAVCPSCGYVALYVEDVTEFQK